MELTHLLEKKIRPRAERMDAERRLLCKGFKILGRQKLLAQRASKEFGGAALPSEAYFTFTELLQSYSGALGFLQRQHQAAARFISNSDQTALKEQWLVPMAKGKRRVGVSVSHLRTPAAPCVEARPTDGRWLLKGHVPWVSGYRVLDWLVVGFFCPQEGLEGMGLIRFKKGRTLRVSRPLNTIALSSIQTVSIELKDLQLSEESVLSLSPIGTYTDASHPLDVQFVNLSALALGFLRELQAPRLFEDYQACRKTFLESGATAPLYAEMNRIATHLSHLARFSMGTRGVICPNSVERRCRELMLFSVILPSIEISRTCLELLLS